jgi:hypothetical protein
MNYDDPNTPPISNEKRTELKKLYSYAGTDLPDSVKQKAMELSAMGVSTGWIWDNGGDCFQCVLHLCDMDAKTIDSAGYAAIRPIGESQYALEFCLWPSCDLSLIFQTMQEAQRYLDTLLGADTPQIPPFQPPFETA